MKFALSLALLFSIPAFAASLCEEAGGVVQFNDRSRYECHCPGEDRVIYPIRDRCLSKMIGEVASPGITAPQPDCEKGFYGPNRSQWKTLSEVPRSLFCEDPMTYVCSPDLNPFAKKEYETVIGFHEMRDRLAQKNYIQEFIKKKISKSPVHSKNLTCDSLVAFEARMKCESFVEQELYNELFTQDRMKKIKALFEKLKVKAVTYFEGRKELFKKQRRLEESELLERVISSIREANATFLFTYPQRSGYNMMSLQISDQSKFLGVPLPFFELIELIAVDGMALRVDENPEAFEAALAHEIAHYVMGPSYFNFEDEVFPFEDEISCLKRDDSIQLHSNDASCYEQLLAKEVAFRSKYITGLSTRESHHEKALRKAIETARSYPDVPFHSPVMNSSEQCRMSQAPEGIADLLGLEIYLQGKQMDQEKLKDLTSVFCFERMVLGKQASLNQRTNTDTHPSSRERTNSVIFAHPKIREAFGCPAPKPRSAPADNGGIVYCGGQ